MLGPLLLLLLHVSSLVEVRGAAVGNRPTKGLFQELAGVQTGGTGEAFGLNGGFAVAGDDDFDPHWAPPATSMVILMEPSASCCSVT